MNNSQLTQIKKTNNLLPAIIQEQTTGEVLMLGFVNDEALEKTIKTGFVWFWSRSRKRLWQKGESSGNKLKVMDIYRDCDSDAYLIKVRPIGNSVCHKGNKSCFAKI